jgi:hypothetical protein
MNLLSGRRASLATIGSRGKPISWVFMLRRPVGLIFRRTIFYLFGPGEWVLFRHLHDPLDQRLQRSHQSPMRIWQKVALTVQLLLDVINRPFKLFAMSRIIFALGRFMPRMNSSASSTLQPYLWARVQMVLPFLPQ